MSDTSALPRTMARSAVAPAETPHPAARSEAAAASHPVPEIVINGRFLTQSMAGVQRFGIETVKAIDGLIDSGEYAALKGHIEILAPSTARDFPLRNIPLRRCGASKGYFWEQVEFPMHAGGRLLLNLCMLGPVLVRRQIVVVHDATIRAFPASFSRTFRAAYGFLIPRLCRHADCTVTVSEFSRQEIGKWYGVDVADMPICFEGGDHIIAVEPDRSILDRLGLAGRKFFLAVGVGSNNKNVETVVAAFQKAQLPNTLLVLTGKREVRVHGRQSEVTLPGVRAAGFVSDSELRTLYEQALGLVYPSRYEGFGLPPVEAMMCGCPVIISDQPALTELYDGAALQCGMDDVDELARLMHLLSADPARRTELIAAGRARAARFTWRATARFLLDLCIQQAARRAAR
jgi:glycosyltransferase involved in cell wall biosynthesis